MDIQVCVCGAGTMGSGIAQVFATKGFPVILFDINTHMLESARDGIERNLQFLVDKEKINEAGKEEIIDRIQYTDHVEQCQAFLIVEAIIEDKDAKVALFNQLASINNEEVIFASNTSSVSISAMQQQIPFPQRVAGLHFFNPAYIMPLVEIIKGTATSETIIATLKEITGKIGKQSIVCKDAPGFIVNRVARPYYLESLRLLEDEVASVEEIDELLEATGFKMGPFRLMDMIGMDINLATSESVYASLGKPERLRPSEIQKKMVATGALGKKSGNGFYQY